MRRDETVSPQLKPALLALDETLKLLASELDAVVFRDTWKAIAVAINRELYNDVATEAKFSFQVGTWHPSGCLLYIRPAALDTEAWFLTQTKTPLVHTYKCNTEALMRPVWGRSSVLAFQFQK